MVAEILVLNGSIARGVLVVNDFVELKDISAALKKSSVFPIQKSVSAC